MAYQKKDIGVHAHQSRFALLSVDSDSEDGEEHLQSQVAMHMFTFTGSRDLLCTQESWKFAKSGGAPKKRNSSSSSEQQQQGNKAALKNAKKRSRKKNRTQSNSSDVSQQQAV